MSFAGLLNQTITIYPKTGYDAYGRESVGTGVSVKSRFQATTRRRLLPDGSLITIVGIVYVPSDTAVETDYRIDYLSENYKVYGKYLAIDGEGTTHHIKLELVKWLEA